MRFNQRRIQRLKDATLRKPYLFYFIFIFIAYVVFNSLINKSYETLDVFVTYARWFVIPFIAFNYLIIPALVATTVNLSIMKFKDAREIKTNSGRFAFLGVFGGILGGACPGCFVGLFPAFLGLFGTTITLSSLPLFGLELQIGSALLLGTAIILLTRDTVCKVDFKDNGRKSKM